MESGEPGNSARGDGGGALVARASGAKRGAPGGEMDSDETGREMNFTPHVTQESVAQDKSSTPHVAEKAGARKRKESTPHVARTSGKVISIDDYATRGTNQGTGSKPTTKLTPQDAELPVAKWFTFERVKTSIGTVAYRYRWHQLVDKESKTYQRMPPVYVRYLTDAADAVIRKKGKDVIKQLVRQWYEEKCGQAVSAREGMG